MLYIGPGQEGKKQGLDRLKMKRNSKTQMSLI